MKKSIVKMMAAAILISGLAFSFGIPDAMAGVSDSKDCPNGCLANGNGCACNGWWPCYLEAGSGNPV